jgi:hypothetical protein
MAGQGGARVEDGVARQGGPVAFGIFAAQELAAAPMVAHGRCEAAGCGAAFDRKRTSQKFCGASCERATVAEFRRWGHRMAPALLVWRVGKYAPRRSQEADACRAARRFLSRLQSEWLLERASGVRSWVEPFSAARVPLVSVAGVPDAAAGPGCLAAGCGTIWERSRAWQVFCCTACERATVAEFRRWGHRMAPALLVWRVGKYERHDNLIQQRTRAARRFISACQSAWVAERGAKWDS